MSVKRSTRRFKKHIGKCELADTDIIIDKIETIKAHRVFLADCESLYPLLHNDSTWGDKGILHLQTNDFVKSSHYHKFFRVLYTEDLETMEEEIVECIFQMHWMADRFGFEDLIYFTNDIIRDTISYDGLISLVNYFYNILPIEGSPETNQTRMYIETFISSFIQKPYSTHNEDIMTDLLGIMRIELFQKIVLSETCPISFSTRLDLYHSYLSVHFGISDHSQVRECMVIDIEARKILDYLHNKILDDFYLRKDEYYSSGPLGSVLSRKAVFKPNVRDNGENMRVYDIKLGPKEVITEKNIRIYLDGKDIQRMSCNAHSKTPEVAATCIVKLYIPKPGTTNCISSTEFILTELRLQIINYNKHVLLACNIRDDNACTVSISGYFKVHAFLNGQVSTHEFPSDGKKLHCLKSNGPRTVLIPNLEWRNFIDKDALEPVPRNRESVLPLRFVFDIRRIQIQEYADPINHC